MSIWTIGDVHGNIGSYIATIGYINRQEERISGSKAKSLQVGDLGIGFPRSEFVPYMEDHKFIYGNHDNPEVCRKHPNCLGDFGVWEDIFFVSGAWSIDKNDRTPMLDWWPDEELSWDKWNQCIELYKQVRPSIVVSHDCPEMVSFDFWKIKCTSNTAKGLQALFDIHQPDLHVFGHHHKAADGILNGTRFVCLPELQTFKIK